jgi:BMFP domain-containing protein YqiC
MLARFGEAAMQTDNRLLDDLARMANGALNTLSSVREEIESRVRERVERMLADMDMVPREEFEAVKAMAQAARTEQEDLAARLAELERRVNELAGSARSGTAKPRTGRSAGAEAGTAEKAKPAATRRRATKTGPASAKPVNAKPASE